MEMSCSCVFQLEKDNASFMRLKVGDIITFWNAIEGKRYARITAENGYGFSFEYISEDTLEDKEDWEAMLKLA